MSSKSLAVAVFAPKITNDLNDEQPQRACTWRTVDEGELPKQHAGEVRTTTPYIPLHVQRNCFQLAVT